MKNLNFSALNFHLGFLPFEIFAISQIESARNQNQSTRVDIFSRNFEEKNKSKNRADQQFQISIRSNSGYINQTECFENKVLNEVSASPQKEEHRQLEWSRSHPNPICRWEGNDTCDERKIEQHRNAIFFFGDHFFDENILQREKESRSNRNAIENVEMEIVVGCPTGNNRQSNESYQCRNPSKFCYILAEKNFGKHERKQRNSPENNNDFGQRQFNDSIDVEKKTHRAEHSTNDVQEKLICFKRRFSTSDHERKQCNQSEKKPKKSHLESVQSLSHEFRNNIVGAADKHLAEKKCNPLPISIQGHKFSEIKSESFITFMVENENIF